MTHSETYETPTRVAGEDDLQLVTFEIAGVRIGIDIAMVQEINRLIEVTPVPGAPKSIDGVVNLRGEVVTVINAHHVLDLDRSDDLRARRNLILNIDGERIGILVDTVSDILTLHRGDLVPRPANMRSIDTRFVDSIYLQDSDLIVILDPNGLLSSIQLVSDAA